MKFKVSYQCAIFFTVITMILFAKSESQNRGRSYYQEDDPDSSHSNPQIPEMNVPTHTSKKTGPIAALRIHSSLEEFRKIPKESQYSIYRPPNLKSPKSQGSANCPALRKSLVIELRHILSPDIISQPDPFYYLVDNVMKISDENFPVVSRDLDKQLVFKRLPECYIPFAKVLASLLWCESNGVLIRITHVTQEIQKRFSPNNDYSSLRSYFDSSTSPELLELYSDDIFNDPKPPMRILYKLLDMPKSSIQNLQTQLNNLLELKTHKNRIILPSNQDPYILYAERLSRLLKKESALDDLKRNVAQIQKTSTSNEHLPATSVDSSATKIPDEIIVNQ